MVGDFFNYDSFLGVQVSVSHCNKQNLWQIQWLTELESQLLPDPEK